MLTTGAFLPQVIKTFKSGRADDLSLMTFLMMFSGTVCWFAYGYILNDKPLMYANAITGLLAGSILLVKIKSMITPKSTE